MSLAKKPHLDMGPESCQRGRKSSGGASASADSQINGSCGIGYS